MTRSTKRFLGYSAVVGFVIAWGVIGINTLLDGTTPLHVARWLETASLVLCPPSFSLMAADNAPGPMHLFLMLEVGVLNGALYALGGTILRYLWRQLKSTGSP